MIKLVVFDLDFTLWNAGGLWCDCTCPPYERKNGYVYDAEQRKIMLYPDVINILSYLKNKNIKIAIASRTEEPEWAKEILDLFDIRHLFDYEEIFPDRKTTHLKNISQKSGIRYEEMIFFDDEERNIEDVEKLGVKSILLKNGISIDIVQENI